MNIDLSSTESELLIDVVKTRLGEMREQVYHAETPRFKDELKQRKAALEGVLSKLSATKGSSVLH